LFACSESVCLHICMCKCVRTGLRLAAVHTSAAVELRKQKALTMHEDANPPLVLLDASM